MGEAFIVRRGCGGTGKLFAAIGVTYPAGSVCTCTMGSKTLTAKDTSGQALFAIPSVGDWTVKAVSGTQTASAVISVTEDGPRAYYVSLAYQLMPTDFDLAAYGTKGVDYEVVQGDDTVIPEADYNKYLDWKIRLLTSGTLRALKSGDIDAFLVGGGGGGGGTASSGDSSSSGGGGGGYTKMASITVSAETDYAITVGAGGARNGDGGSTTAFGVSAAGGKKGNVTSTGGAGGSGGGGYGTSGGGAGGADGASGVAGTSSGGAGQGTTTREFGEAGATLYAGGGGGGSNTYATASNAAGGAGGGGNGAYKTPGTAGTANTGGGGGGGSQSYPSNPGGSGIVIIRFKKEAV